MRLARLGPAGAEVPVVLASATAFDLRPVTADLDPAFLAGGGIARIEQALEAGSLPELADADRLRSGLPCRARAP
jgi:hypothetical protein